MREISIHPGDPRHPEARALLEQSHALMQALFNPEDNHYLSVEELCADDVEFLVGELDGRIAGTGALARRDGYAEIKAMYVSPDARGVRLGEKMLSALEEAARAEGFSSLKLETGDKLVAAHRLYKRFGFGICDPFGAYEANSASVFMEKAL